MVDQEVSDGAPVRLLHHTAGGVVREVCYQGLRPRCDALRERVGRQPELILSAAGDRHRGSAGEGDAGGVRDIAGFGDQNLITGVHDSPDGDISRLRDTARHDDLLLGIVGSAEPAIEVMADGAPEPGRPLVRCIGGRPLLYRVDGCLTDAPGGHEIRFTDTQGYDVLHRLRDIEELSYPGGRDSADPL